MKMQKDRKYFDSGDYALSKAGKAPQSTVGTAIPNPENIPHASTPGNGHNNGHTNNSVSPTSSSNPFQKDSGLSTDENTTPPVEAQTEQLTSTDETMSDAHEVTISEASAAPDTTTPETPIEVDSTTVAPETAISSKSPE